MFKTALIILFSIQFLFSSIPSSKASDCYYHNGTFSCEYTQTYLNVCNRNIRFFNKEECNTTITESRKYRNYFNRKYKKECKDYRIKKGKYCTNLKIKYNWYLEKYEDLRVLFGI